MEDELKQEVEEPEEETQEEPEESPEEEEESPKEEPGGEAIAAKKELGPAPEEEQSNVQKRIDILTWEKHETRRKLDLLKTNPEEYYRQYPEERPQRPPEPEEEDLEDYENMIVRGGTYDGYTLGDLAKEKPLTAQKILNDFLEAERSQARQLQDQKVLARESWKNDVNKFGAFLCEEKLSKKPEELTKEERREIDDLILSVDQWKRQNRKEFYSYRDAYLLMNKDSLLKTAKERTARKLVTDLKKNPIGSISGRVDKPLPSIDYDGMTEDQLSAHVFNMSDVQAAKFYRDAPASLKAKYASWPWD